jgi:dolichol-phosphate mannosyltransferase
MKLSVVVPCYNEEDNIDKLEDRIFPVITKLIGSRLPDGGPIDAIEVVFVDDGSRDGTYQTLVDAFGSYDHPAISVKFRKHDMNRGLWGGAEDRLSGS